MSKLTPLSNEDIPTILSIIENAFGVKIPKEGVLSGQALASAIMEYYGVGAPVYNDIDIYIPAYKKPEDNFYLSGDQLSLVVPPYGAFSTTYDGSVVIPEKTTSYKDFISNSPNNIIHYVSRNPVLSSKYCGHFNYITINRANPSTLYRDILETFDFNSSMVSIDLERNLLFMHPRFIDFLNTNELKVYNYSAFHHAYIRLFKKIKELQCHCNLDFYNNHLSDLIKLNNLIYDEINSLEHKFLPSYTVFGKKYFELWKGSDASAIIDIKEEVIKYGSKDTVLYRPVAKKTDFDTFDFEEIYETIKKQSAYPSSLSFPNITNLLRTRIAYLNSNKDILAPTTRKYYISTLSNNNILKKFSSYSEPSFFLDSNVSKEKMKAIESFFNKNHKLYRIFLYVNNIKLSELESVYNLLRPLLKEHGEQVITFVENYFLNNTDNALQINNLEEYIEHRLLLTNKPIYPARNLTSPDEAFSVIELNTSSLLNKTGKIMHNCLARYTNVVDKNRIVVYIKSSSDISNDSSAITIEFIKKQDLNRFHYLEHYPEILEKIKNEEYLPVIIKDNLASFNKPPSDKNRDFISRFLEHNSLIDISKQNLLINAKKTTVHEDDLFEKA